MRRVGVSRNFLVYAWIDGIETAACCGDFSG
jgi:hypothetical protein